MGTADDGDPERSSRQALLDAALRLVTERPPSSISGRELAMEAGVNYGLLHYHFGTKDELVRTAWQQHSEWLVEEVMAGGTRPMSVEEATEDRAIWGVAGQMMLEPGGFRAFRDRFPVVEAYREIVERSDPDGDPIHHMAVVASICTLLLGWPVFGIRNAANVGLDPGGDERALDRLREHVRSLQASVGLGDDS